MAAAELHFFDADEPNGSPLLEVTTDDDFFKSFTLDIQRDSLGSGKVNWARKVGAAVFTRQIVVPEVLVRVLIPSIHATKYVGGFFINPRQQQVVSEAEEGGDGFTFGGPGPKHYLERMILWSESFTDVGGNVDRDSGVWVWPETASAGRILNRLLNEDQDNPDGPFLPDLTNTFTATHDSDGVPWSEDVSSGADDFILRIGDDYLKILWTLEDIASLTTEMNLGEVGAPLLELNAYETFGRDLSGPMGADTVHWTEGINIRADLDVEGSSFRKASHALVKGNDGVYELAVRDAWTPGELKKVVATAYDSSSPTILDRAGRRFLRNQTFGEQQIDLAIVTGFDPEEGLYMPGWDGSDGHFWVGDTISLTTGMDNSTILDYQSEDQVVTGIEIELAEAVRDDTDLQAARSFDIKAILNEERKSSHTSRDLAGNRGTVTAPPNIIRLCRLPTAGTDFATRYYFSDDTYTAITPLASDAAWSDGSGSETVRMLKAAPDDTFTGGGSGRTVFAGVSEALGNRLDGLWAVQITGTDLLAAVQAGGIDLHGQVRARSRSGAGVSESAQDNIYQWVWRVWRSGTGFIDTMLDAHSLSSGGALKFVAQTTHQNREWIGSSDPVPSAALNDYIIIDMGVRHFTPTSGAAGAAINYASQTALGDLPVDQSTQTNLNSWVALEQTGAGGFEGDLPADTVRQDEENAGTSSRVARCDHQHAHGLLAFDGSNYHSLSQLANYIVDAGAAPAVTDDGDDGYVVGTLWIDHSVSPADVYILTDPAVGAAVWVHLNVSGGGGAPSTADYLVGTSQGGLSAEIVVGTTPGGELGGTWASPTVDATHGTSGGSHATQDHDHTGGGDGGDLDSPVIDGYLVFNEESAPSTPAANTARVYVKSDGRVYSMTDGGIEYGPFDALGSGGGGSPISLGGDMAIRGTAVTHQTSDTTSHTVNIATGSVAGERLLIFFACDDSPTITAPSGWTTRATAGSAGNVSVAFIERIADGSEGSTVVVTTSTSQKSESWAIRVSAAHASTASEGTASGLAATTGPQPPAHTLSGWSGIGLWWLVLARDQSSGAAEVQSLPVPFSHRYMETNAALDTAGLYVCSWYGTAAATFTPNLFRIVNEQSAIATVAVRPL